MAAIVNEQTTLTLYRGVHTGFYERGAINQCSSRITSLNWRWQRGHVSPLPAWHSGDCPPPGWPRPPTAPPSSAGKVPAACPTTARPECCSRWSLAPPSPSPLPSAPARKRATAVRKKLSSLLPFCWNIRTTLIHHFFQHLHARDT